MKKNLIMLAACFMLCGCTDPAKPAATLSPEATPYVRLAPTAEERPGELPAIESGERREYASFWDMMDDFYEGRRGNFYFHGRELAEFETLPQNEPYSFTLHLLPGAAGDEILSGLEEEMQALESEIVSIERAAMAGELTAAGEEWREALPEIAAQFDESFLAMMPEEWYALRQRGTELAERIMARRRELDLACCVEAARDLRSLGCEAGVYACRSVENGQEYYSYVCTLKLSPARLWEISEKTANRYFIEQLYESVRLRHDIPVDVEAG